MRTAPSHAGWLYDLGVRSVRMRVATANARHFERILGVQAVSPNLAD
jgi:hypothetical protein